MGRQGREEAADQEDLHQVARDGPDVAVAVSVSMPAVLSVACCTDPASPHALTSTQLDRSRDADQQQGEVGGTWDGAGWVAVLVAEHGGCFESDVALASAKISAMPGAPVKKALGEKAAVDIPPSPPRLITARLITNTMPTSQSSSTPSTLPDSSIRR